MIAIAGAAGGLGPVVAERLADAGARLALTDVDQGRLDALVADLGLAEERADARVVDLLDETARDRRARPRAALRRTDGLVHLVGGWRGGEPLASTPLADYEWLHDLLVRTVQHASRAFYDALAAPHGRFVLVSSAQAQARTAPTPPTPPPRRPPRPGPRPRRSVREGRLCGDRQRRRRQRDRHPADARRDPDKPFKTFTSTEDIADAIAFIRSDAAAKMNGKRLALHP